MARRQDSDGDLALMGSGLMGGANVSYMSPEERQHYIDGVSIKAKYIGMLEVAEPRGMQMIVTAIGRVRALHKANKEAKLKVWFVVSTSGIKIVDAETHVLRDSHALENVSFVSALPSNKKVFAFVSVSTVARRKVFKCHVFKSENKSLLIAETIGRCFTLALELHRQEHQQQVAVPTPPVRAAPPSRQSAPPPRPAPYDRSLQRSAVLPDTFDGVVEAVRRTLAPYPISSQDNAFLGKAFAKLQAFYSNSLTHATNMENAAASNAIEKENVMRAWHESLQLCQDLRERVSELESHA